MKKIFLLFLFLSGSVFAQIQTTPNVIGTTVSPAPTGIVQSWTGFVNTDSQGGGVLGGNVPGYNPTTGQFMFGYSQGTFAYTMAINSALSGTGIQVTGIEYGMMYFNQEFSRGTLSVTATVTSNTGSVLNSYSHSLPQTISGWTQWSQSQTFNNPYSLANLGNASLNFTGKDDRFWAGYYGPQFKDPYLRFNYTADACASNPLSSPECPGYAAAYLTQQCTINPLYSPSCPGYTTAQCNINPLYSQVCPGYQAAYYTQQCTLNPLYDSGCPGYAEAYFTQQCNLNGLYSTTCPNYAQAYAKKNLLDSTTTTQTKVTTGEPSLSISSTGKVETAVSKTGDSNVDSVIEQKATSASPSDATAAVRLTPPIGGQNAVAQTPAQSQQKTETKTASPSNERQQTAKSDTRKENAQQRAKEEMKKAETASFEGQIAVQASVIGAMSFVPGFDAYQTARIIDINALQLQRQYGKDVVDNRRLGWGLFGPSDRRHQEMVDGQYR